MEEWCLLVCFTLLITVQVHLSQGSTAHSELDPPTSISIQDVPQTCQQVGLGNSSTEVPSSNCVKLAVKASHHKSTLWELKTQVQM